MTILEKLSDRGGFIFEAIKLILVNIGPMDQKRLQWELFNRGIYVKRDLLLQAMSVMKEKGMISKPNENKGKDSTEEAQADRPTIIQP